ncbi:MAG: amidohydrolase family protein, partial [Myxococcales bacterium]
MASTHEQPRLRAFEPELLYTAGAFRTGAALVVDGAGRIHSIGAVPDGSERIRLPGVAMLPGLVNAHSHAFQRVIRGRTEFRAPGHESDDFWSWREAMYGAALELTPEDVHVASRMAFLEMALSGITHVG